MSKRFTPDAMHITAVLGAMFATTSWTVCSAQILSINDDSLTEVMFTQPSQVQNVRPRPEQRGVGIDGLLRARPALPWAIAANPFESGQPGATLGDLRLASGVYSPTEIDLYLPAHVPWVIGRTYNVRQIDDSDEYRDSDRYQGSTGSRSVSRNPLRRYRQQPDNARRR